MAKLAPENVAKLLVEYGRRAALAGNNPCRAYLRAAESLAAQTAPLARLVEEDRLREIPGVGDAIADIITKLYETGTHPSLEKMRRKVPEGVLDMLSIPGLRPEEVLKLHEKLGVATLDELEAAAKQDRIKDAKGLGAALRRKILQGLAMRRETQGARHVHRAEELIIAAQESLKRADPSLTQIVPAGDFRRGNELVTDLALVAQADQLEGGPRQLKTGELSVTLTDAKRFGISLFLATGSEKHVDELRELAKQKSYKLTPDGLQRAG
jgi:DNA polymerase (family X)